MLWPAWRKVPRTSGLIWADRNPRYQAARSSVPWTSFWMPRKPSWPSRGRLTPWRSEFSSKYPGINAPVISREGYLSLFFTRVFRKPLPFFEGNPETWWSTTLIQATVHLTGYFEADDDDLKADLCHVGTRVQDWNADSCRGRRCAATSCWGHLALWCKQQQEMLLRLQHHQLISVQVAEADHRDRPPKCLPRPRPRPRPRPPPRLRPRPKQRHPQRPPQSLQQRLR